MRPRRASLGKNSQSLSEGRCQLAIEAQDSNWKWRLTGKKKNEVACGGPRIQREKRKKTQLRAQTVRIPTHSSPLMVTKMPTGLAKGTVASSQGSDHTHRQYSNSGSSMFATTPACTASNFLVFSPLLSIPCNLWSPGACVQQRIQCVRSNRGFYRRRNCRLFPYGSSVPWIHHSPQTCNEYPIIIC